MPLKNILVPLDGSKLAEVVLPLATLIAERNDARLIFFHVIEQNPPAQVHGESHLTDEQDASVYLTGIIKYLPAGIRTDQHVHTSAEKDVALSIVAHSRELNVDLIVMCAHGQSGLQSRIFGNIAQKVLSMGEVPVLLISPEKTDQILQNKCQSILVPLDGDPDHEAGLDMAVELTQVCHAKIHLIMVVHELSTLPGEQAASAVLLPNVTNKLLDMACEEGELYLVEIIGKLLDKQIQVSGEVSRGDPAKEITRAAIDQHADIIVLGTHGKTAMDAFWSGSVSPKLATQTHLPLLLVPVHEA